MKLAFSKAVFVAAGVALFAGSLLNAEDKFSPVIVIHGGTSGLELTKDEFKVNNICDARQLGKLNKSSFKSKKVISTLQPLELLHMDLFGPTQV